MMTQFANGLRRWSSTMLPGLPAVLLLAGLGPGALARQTPIPRPKPKPDINSLQKSPTGSRLAVPIPVAKPGTLKDLPRGVVSLAVVPNDEYAACLQDLE